jgi:glyoxylate reductase
MLLGRDLHDATLGIVGIGRIGREVARRAHGFQMRVLYADERPLGEEQERELKVTRVELPELLAQADFVTLHVPLTETTRHLIGTDQLKLMKRSAVLVNTSRGPVVHERALAEALEQGWIMAAGLDVYEHEPVVDERLLRLENVVLAPHIAGASVKTRSEMSAVAARNLIAGIQGNRPANLVNADVFA